MLANEGGSVQIKYDSFVLTPISSTETAMRRMSVLGERRSRMANHRALDCRHLEGGAQGDGDTHGFLSDQITTAC